MKEFFGSMGRTLGELLAGVNSLYTLFADVSKVVFASFIQKKVVKPRHVFHQMLLMGVDSVPIICLVGASVGMVLALQAGYQLKDIGALNYTGGLVSLSVMRELGPLVAAIVITGRVGARMAAELGTMKVQEEIDALSTMGLNPIRYLVAPRCVSLMVVLPCLTIIANCLAMIGGFIVGVFGMGINPYLYITNSFDALVLKDIYTGLAKSAIFSMIIALVSCSQGLSVEGGADGVGRSTTAAVVTSIILIIIADCLSTAVFFYAFPK